MSQSLKTFSKQNCPICGKTGWCAGSVDLVLCTRTHGPDDVNGYTFKGMTKDGQSGIYVTADANNKTPPPNVPRRSLSTEQLEKKLAEYRLALTDDLRLQLATLLSLPVCALDHLEIGWCDDLRWWNPEESRCEGPPGCWVFPERDGQGRLVGLGLRWPDGKKGQLTGSMRGLTLPIGWREKKGPILVVEGPSDVLAGSSVGLNLIGRPSNTGGAEYLSIVGRDRQIIVAGENDQKEDGRWPGRDGANSVARRLEEKWGRPVPIAMPPTGIKDLRAWIIALRTEGKSDDEIGEIVLAACHPPALLILASSPNGRAISDVKAFRWAEGVAATPFHTDRFNLNVADKRASFIRQLSRLQLDFDRGSIERQLIALAGRPAMPKASPSRAAGKGKDAPRAPSQSGLPEVSLPGGTITINESGSRLGELLAATGRNYIRGGAVVSVSYVPEPIIEPIKPAALASIFESVAELRHENLGGQDQSSVPAICSEPNARLILNCDAFRRALPPIVLVSRCPLLIERNGQLVQISGYDRSSGILAMGEAVPDVPLSEAVPLLNGVVSEFDFVTRADHARALAAIITPIFVLSGLLGARAPIDATEADESQAGKGFRNRLTAAIYNHLLSRIIQMKGGVGSMEESFNAALIRGDLLISLDNIRGKLNSPAIESFLTEDLYPARIPYTPTMNIDTRRILLFLTSNQAEITVDMANRCSCVRIRKRTGHRFRAYPEGDIEKHIIANQTKYLGAVFAVVRHWYASGKPSTGNLQHDFRVWAGIMDWIVQNIFEMGPLLDGHREAQTRMASPLLSWMRTLCLGVRDQGRLSEPLRTSDLVEISSMTPEIEIPGLRADEDLAHPEVKKKVNQAMGRELALCFKDADELSIDSFLIRRLEDRDPENRHFTKLYLFQETTGQTTGCAYEQQGNDPSIGATGDEPAEPDVRSEVIEPTCAYAAPKTAPMPAPMKPQCAPNAPKVPEAMRGGAVNGLFDHGAILESSNKKRIETLRRTGADRRESIATEAAEEAIPSDMTAKAWATELRRLANEHAADDPKKAREYWRRAGEIEASQTFRSA